MTTKTNFLPKKDIISAIDQYLSSHDAVEVLYSMQPWGNGPSDICHSIGIDIRDASIQTRVHLDTEDYFFPIISQEKLDINTEEEIASFASDIRSILTETVCICLSTANDRLDVVYAQSV